MRKLFLFIAIFTSLLVLCLVGEVLLLLLSGGNGAYVLFYIAGVAFICDVVLIILGYKQTHKK